MTYQHTLRYLTERDTTVPYLPIDSLREQIAQLGVHPTVICLSSDKCGRIAARMLRSILQCAGIGCLHAVDSDKLDARERFWLNGKPIPPAILTESTAAIHDPEIILRRSAPDKQATAFPPSHRTAAVLLHCLATQACNVLLLECEEGAPWLRALCELLPKKPACLTLVSPTDEGVRCALSTIPYTTHSVVSHACGQPLYRTLSDACARAGNLPLRIIPVTAMERSSVTLGSQQLATTPQCRSHIRSGTRSAAKAAALATYAVTAWSDLTERAEPAVAAGLELTPVPLCAEPVSIQPLLVVDRVDTPCELSATMADLAELATCLPRPRRVWLDSALTEAVAPWQDFADEWYSDDPYVPSDEATSLWIGSADFLRRLGYPQEKN